jgi:hypothetical protein
LVLLADGSATLINPAGLIRLWSGPRAPSWYRNMMSYFTKHLGFTRAVSAAEVAAGLALVARSSA